MRRDVTALLIALALAVLLVRAWTGVTGAAAATVPTLPTAPASGVLFVEYPLPYPNAQPRYLISTGPGDFWFTMPGISAVGRLVVTTTTDYAFSRYDTPTPNSEPDHLTHRGGTIWFTEKAANRLAALDIASGAITEFPLPTPNSRPTGVDTLPGGDVWLVTENADSIVHRNITGTLTEYTDPALVGGLLSDVDAQDDNAIWVAAPGRHELFTYRPLSGDLNRSFVDDPASQPYQIDRYQDRPWILDKGRQYIGRYAPGTLSLWRWYPVNASDVGLADLFYRQLTGARQVWFTERDANRISQMTIDGTTGDVRQFWRQGLPQSGSLPTGLVADDAGTIWIALSGRNKIVAWQPPYYDFANQLYLPAARRDAP